MTLGTLLLWIGLAAIILTIIVFVLKAHNNIVVSFLQNFCGAFFIFSGWVKAIDPLGTAYKMQDYFKEFETTFADTWLSFIAPIFPFFSNYSVAFSVFMIVLEIVVGFMLIMGLRSKLTGWIFLTIIAFFTALTGFTYLTGYVPQGVNFFEFGKWGPYTASNMKVTDCGCFGDFIKLEPKVSFFKDVFLMIPALLFVFKHKDFHQLFTPTIRSFIAGGVLGFLLVFCLGNFVWDIPKTDFRPFKVGANIKDNRQAELDAMASVKILGWKLKERTSGKIVELSNDVYMKEFKNYPKADWEVVDQIKSQPAVKATKLSEMEFTHPEGYDVTEEILSDPNPAFLVISYKLLAEGKSGTKTIQDSIFAVDTTQMDDGLEMIVRSFDRIEEKEVKTTVYDWDQGFLDDYTSIVTPLAKEAAQDGFKTYVIAGGASPDLLEDLENKIDSGAAFLTADDILLKTIVRSNPGIVLIQNGEIKGKWHKSKFPGYLAVKSKGF